MKNQTQLRVIEKCLSAKYIREWIPEIRRRRIYLVQAWRIIKVHYCGALVGRGVCPIQCELCRRSIYSMFDLDEAKNPEALLTWKAKNISAVRIEELIAKQKVEEAYGFPALETSPDPMASLYRKKTTGNLFLEMEKDYL